MPFHPSLLSLATAVPPYRLDQREVMAAAASLFGGDFADLDRLIGVYGNAAIETRYSCVPFAWYREDHGFAERNRLYIDNSVALLERVADECLARAGLAPGDIDSIVTVSTTGIATPSLDARLMERIGFRRDVERLPIFGLGCAGGVLGLARAAALARAAPESRVLILVVELCALTFRRGDRSKSNIIASALFGDGAAGAIVSCSGEGPTVTGWGEYSWHGTLDVMGWDVADDGLGVKFSRDIPALVRERMRDAATGCLARQDLALDDIDRFVCHPGGVKVIDALEDVFGLPNGGLAETRAVLRDYGNMSAATVLFVLERVLATGDAGRYLLSSLGPGFTAAFLTLEQA